MDAVSDLKYDIISYAGLRSPDTPSLCFKTGLVVGEGIDDHLWSNRRLKDWIEVTTHSGKQDCFLHTRGKLFQWLTLLETARATNSTSMPATVNRQNLLDSQAILPDFNSSMPAEPLGPSPDLMLNSGGFFYAHIPESRKIDR